MRVTLGPKEKKERRIGERLGLKGDRCASPKCAAVRRSYPPGMHGPTGRSRLTSFRLQLQEKQKARLIYGLAERQFRNYVRTATASRGDTGLLLGRLLEQRLDNVIYRMGLARSRAEARQSVAHRHFLVNGKRVNIPSYSVAVGDTIQVRPKSQQSKFFQEFIAPRLEKYELPKWMTLNKADWQGKIIAAPEEEDTPQNINRKKIIEFYSR
jgi:small subunit ribosomal protein S4